MNWNIEESDASLEKSAQRSPTMPAATALNHLCEAIKKAVEDLNTRFRAGFEVRQTETTFEVYELEKPSALLRVDLRDPNDIRYSHFIKRQNETLSGMMQVCVGRNGEGSILFPDLPRSPLQISYQEASRRLLEPIF